MAAIFISPKSNIRFIEIYFLIQSPNIAINDKLIEESILGIIKVRAVFNLQKTALL